jgi:predicted lipid-binding transport protein (Tim44 family)
MFRHRWLIALAALFTALTLAAADARVGGGGSSGSRGSRTFSAPSSTATAPSAAPINRSLTPQATRPSTPLGAPSRPGLFGGGLFGGLAAGFLGAGLFGLLFGHGLFGGMGGIASFLGLILQIVVVVWIARMLFAWFQRRNAPATATGPSGGMHGFSPLGGMLGGSAAAADASQPITIGPSDYDAFERLLTDIQTAYSAEDLNALRAHVTPEMLSYFSEDLSTNASRGLVNRVSNVRLLQGDLSEAWREGNTEYATVAMRFALTDSMVERSTGRVVEGGSPSEATELWTFMRAARGGDWMLSAIQQA